ncbi:MAG TPA: PBP1A family penicillin-binding protein [Epsilonproteobacteria bacterium]|nr:PBP1A family penicillin-binding protein [Campylobacterota bacterium]
MIKGSIILGIILGIAVVGAFVYAYNEIALDADQLIDYKPQVSSVILDRKGNHIAYIFDEKHRLYARYDEIPGRVIEALVAIEDTRFFEHKGVNADAIIRAVIKDIQARSFVEGGSTLTQQLVKNKLLTNEKKFARKLKEAILALKIEKSLTKEQILERYLNEIFFGNGYYGIKTAANGFFHKELHELTLKECAILVGLPNAPTTLNPTKYYKRSLGRANSVLYRMKTLGWISQEEYIEAVKETPTVYQAGLARNVAPYITDEVLRQLEDKFSDVRHGGYTIYTTIDLKYQDIAQESLKTTLQNAKKTYPTQGNDKELNGAMVVVENKTGDILALVGGEDYEKSAFNRATQARRQPGSAFKPFIYQTALDMGYNPATQLTDLARTFEYYENGRRKIWTPKNYEGNFKGFLSLRDALVQSRNLATINLVHDIGVSTISRRLAFLDIPDIPKDMSLALGTLSLSPLKMAQIFSVFANNGHMIEPRLVSKMVSKEGLILYETRPKEIANFTRPEQAYLMTDILKDVVRRGTGKKAQVSGIELAGKTGTTNSNVDTWFCGYSPTLETIVWIGRDDNKPIGKKATGGALPTLAFSRFYREILAIEPSLKRSFDIPNGVFRGEANGKSELYTATSPLPQVAVKQDSKIQTEELLNIEEIDSGNYAPPSSNNGLHPKRKIPRPISSDSGTLF